MNATMIGKWRGVIYHKVGTKKNIVLDKVKIVPELWSNLFSIGSLLKNSANYQTTGLLYHCQIIISGSHLINSF